VTNTSGAPGSGASIRIRGHGSLQTANGPLWVIDGFIGADINSVAPEDIESIEILKDASSTAIYGAKGGNGVIMVTTKRGKKNVERVNFSYYHQVTSVTKELDLLNSSDFMTLRNQALTNVGLPATFTPGQINGTEATDGYIANTNWQDELFNLAQADYFNLSLSGGNDQTTYSLSVNQRKETGIINHSDFKRSGIRLNLDHTISPKLKLGVNADVFRTIGNSFDVTTGWNLGAAGSALNAYPYFPVYDTTGKYYNLSTWDNPLMAAEGQYDNRITTSLLGNFFMTYELIKDLTLKADFSGNYSTQEKNTFVTSQLYGATATRGLAKATINKFALDLWTGTLSATYDKKLGENHHIKLLAAIEQRVSNSHYNFMSGEDMDRETFLWYNMAAFKQANDVIRNGLDAEVYQSVFGRMDYNFKDRYLVEATLRRDGSSKFGPKDKWGTFPSASLAWKIAEEKFIQNLHLFDVLKLRASWGITGNDNINTYQWLPTMEIGNGFSSAVFGGAGSSGGDKSYVAATFGQIPNQSIHWEQSTSTDIGLDMGFFNNRLRFVADVYDRTTSELLYQFPIPLYTGYGDGWFGTPSVTTNFAKMNNKGLELTLGADIVSNPNFKWTCNLSWSKNYNKVVDLGGVASFEINKTKIEQGKSIGNIVGYITDGIFKEGDAIKNTPRFSGDEGVGDQRFLDSNNNGVLTSEDQGIIGNALPDFIYGVVNSFTYKNFELHTILNGVQGVDMYNGTREVLSEGSLGEHNGGAWLKDSWTPENPNSNIPRLSNNYVKKISDRFVEDASFLRVSNIQLSYSLPQRIASRVMMKDVSVYTSLQNWFTITGYTGYDPETHSGGDSNLDLGYDQYNYPSTKSVTFGVKVGF
jgi:TonB-linked SusC/RagA family outer membrane protein